jgi:hypothetical protein
MTIIYKSYEILTMMPCTEEDPDISRRGEGAVFSFFVVEKNRIPKQCFSKNQMILRHNSK